MSFSDVPTCPFALLSPPPAKCPPACLQLDDDFHAPGCSMFDSGYDPADYGPPEVGPRGDEYAWLIPNSPEDPDKDWLLRDSGHGAEDADDEDLPY